jgi:UDP-N-acetylmuramoylalanine--D-glutamate ligase
MIPVRAHAGRRVAVLRLTRAGLGVAKALHAGGAVVTVWDEDEARRQAACAEGLTVEDPSTRDWSDLALLVVGERSMLDEAVSIRAVEIAQALEIPVVDPDTLFAEALTTDYATTLCVFTGSRATVTAQLVRTLLRGIGMDVIGPDPSKLQAAPGPGAMAVMAVERGDLPASPDLLVVTDTVGAPFTLADTISTMTGPVVLNADDTGAARLATRAPDRAVLASGRQSLGGGVFVCAGTVFDGYDGAPRRIAEASQSSGVAFTPPGLLAMAHAVLRAAALSAERAAEALEGFQGLDGWGAPMMRFGPVPILDYSGATSLREALDALRAPGPVIWIAGPALEKGAGALVEASGLTPSAVYLTGDKRKAAKALARLCPVRTAQDVELLAARAVFTALKAGPDARIVIAPGCEGGVDPATITGGLSRLIAALKPGVAA